MFQVVESWTFWMYLGLLNPIIILLTAIFLCIKLISIYEIKYVSLLSLKK